MTIRGHVHGVSLSSILIPVRAERCPEFSDMARPEPAFKHINRSQTPLPELWKRVFTVHSPAGIGSDM